MPEFPFAYRWQDPGADPSETCPQWGYTVVALCRHASLVRPNRGEGEWALDRDDDHEKFWPSIVDGMRVGEVRMDGPIVFERLAMEDL